MTVDAGKSQDRLRTILMPTVILGAGFGVLLFGSLGTWAGLAPLGSAAIASGNVSPDSSRKTIQHLEGGIVRQINVVDGQVVARGKVLATLEPVQARSLYLAKRQQWARLHIMRYRLEAHATQSATFEPPTFPDIPQDLSFKAFLSNQVSQFNARRKALSEREQILGQQIEQLKQQAVAKTRENLSLEKQREFLEDEIADKKELYSKNLARKPEWLALERARADVMGRHDGNIAELSRIQERMREIDLSILTNRTQFEQEISEQLIKTNSDIAQLEETLPASEDILRRTDIVAPVDGTIHSMRFKTVGGVVRPGEALLDIVPLNDDLIIDARLSPNDIDVVRTGLSAEIYLSPYVSRHAPRLVGKVIHVSPDIIRDQNQNVAPYYELKVKIEKAELARATDVVMTPGMPAEVYIMTGTRTFGQYFMDPISKSFRRAFRED